MNEIRDKTPVMARVLDEVCGVDFAGFTAGDVRAALETRRDAARYLSKRDFAALLSVAALPMLDEIAAAARAETRRQFGNNVSLFTPLYIANWCENQCAYCGFNSTNRIVRNVLSLDEIKAELDAIAATGLRDVLLLTGESRVKSPPEYIADAVSAAVERFTSVGLEVYPLDTGEYALMRERGADYVCVYQETYDPGIYAEVHHAGPKRDFARRFESQERALRAGIRGVSFGALLGLADYRRDALATGLHAWYLQRGFPQSDFSFSAPRLRPHAGSGRIDLNGVGERQLLQVMCVYRLFMPQAGISISTRERPAFRDAVTSICATRISAGVSVAIGGHATDTKTEGQFDISDPRSVNEVETALRGRGLQPVYSDYIRM